MKGKTAVIGNGRLCEMSGGGETAVMGNRPFVMT
jgi:hypothetical protein